MIAPAVALLALAFAPEIPVVPGDIEWAAPPCASRSAFDQALESRLDEPVRDDVSLRFQIGETQSGFSLVSEIVVAGTTEVRRIESGSCPKLVDAAALLAAMALDPTPTDPGGRATKISNSTAPTQGPPSGPQLDSWQTAARDEVEADPAAMQARARAEIGGGGALIGGGLAAGVGIGYGVYRASLAGLGPAGPRDRLTTIAITTGVLSGIVVAAATTAGGATLVRRGRKRRARLDAAGVGPTTGGVQATVRVRF